MLSPKRVKHRKQQRGRRNGKAYLGSTIAFGQFGLKALEPAWSRIQVVSDNGRRVDGGDARVDRSAPRLFRVSLEALAPGVYTVRWRVVSVDSHVSEGRFTFHVAP